MKYIRLSTNGPTSMTHDVARQQMTAAKRRCGGSAGSLRLTRPDAHGVYYAIFESAEHAAQFAAFCREHNVRHEVMDALPDGKTVRTGRQTRLTAEELARLLAEGHRRNPGNLGSMPFFTDGPKTP